MLYAYYSQNYASVIILFTYSYQSVGISDKLAGCALNRLSRSTNVTNSVFLLAIVATPIDRAHLH